VVLSIQLSETLFALMNFKCHRTVNAVTTHTLHSPLTYCEIREDLLEQQIGKIAPLGHIICDTALIDAVVINLDVAC
jgi:hypothetical protein